MRYIIHLLPTEAQRLAYDDARTRLAAAIGRNRALDYPTAHITLAQGIEDALDDPAPIDPAALRAALARWRGIGGLPLTVGAPAETREHLLLPLVDTPALAALRRSLHEDIRRAASGIAGDRIARAARVFEQTWPHLTLAQDIDGVRWARGMALLARDDAALLRAPLLGAELALIARDVAAGEPYRIVMRVPLNPSPPRNP